MRIFACYSLGHVPSFLRIARFFHELVVYPLDWLPMLSFSVLTDETDWHVFLICLFLEMTSQPTHLQNRIDLISEVRRVNCQVKLMLLHFTLITSIHFFLIRWKIYLRMADLFFYSSRLNSSLLHLYWDESPVTLID